jgi:hypothetical protein
VKYEASGWELLGRTVRYMRQRAGYRTTKSWADVLGRSTRTVLGLERGEPVGEDTLERIAAVLSWPPDVMYALLSAYKIERMRGDVPVVVNGVLLDHWNELRRVAPYRPGGPELFKPQPTVETVGGSNDADDFVATGTGGTQKISNEEVLARLRRMRQELDEIERGLTGGDP